MSSPPLTKTPVHPAPRPTRPARNSPFHPANAKALVSGSPCELGVPWMHRTLDAPEGFVLKPSGRWEVQGCRSLISLGAVLCCFIHFPFGCWAIENVPTSPE